MKNNEDNIKNKFHRITEWVFDLDNTLYPKKCDLFNEIDVNMSRYVAELLGLEFTPARKIQKDLFREYGTTLCGLMKKYEVDPFHFLEEVHKIDYSPVKPNPELAENINKLKGRKHIFTNANNSHAEKVIQNLGIQNQFDSMFDIIKADLIPKPNPETYMSFIKIAGVNPSQAVMFEDMPRNLVTPKKLGMITVLINETKNQNQYDQVDEYKNVIDFVTDDLNKFLSEVTEVVGGNKSS